MDFLSELKNKLQNGMEVCFNVKAIAGAKKVSIENFDIGIIKIKINKKAIEGQANKAIIELISEEFNVPKKNVIIVSGEKNSLKSLRILPKRPIIK